MTRSTHVHFALADRLSSILVDIERVSFDEDGDMTVMVVVDHNDDGSVDWQNFKICCRRQPIGTIQSDNTFHFTRMPFNFYSNRLMFAWIQLVSIRMSVHFSNLEFYVLKLFSLLNVSLLERKSMSVLEHWFGNGRSQEENSRRTHIV